MTKYTYALHFGVVPTEAHEGVGGIHEIDSGAILTSKTEEVEIDLGSDVRAFISGSWACWGPADQDSEGDDSLHILVQTNSLVAQDVLTLARSLGALLNGDRMLDYAIVSDCGDWSVQTHVVTFASNHVAVLETGSADNLSIPIPA